MSVVVWVGSTRFVAQALVSESTFLLNNQISNPGRACSLWPAAAAWTSNSCAGGGGGGGSWSGLGRHDLCCTWAGHTLHQVPSRCHRQQDVFPHTPLPDDRRGCGRCFLLLFLVLCSRSCMVPGSQSPSVRLTCAPPPTAPPSPHHGNTSR